MNSRFGTREVATAITVSKQAATRLRHMREFSRAAPPCPARGGFPYPARTQLQVRLHENGFDL